MDIADQMSPIIKLDPAPSTPSTASKFNFISYGDDDSTYDPDLPEEEGYPAFSPSAAKLPDNDNVEERERNDVSRPPVTTPSTDAGAHEPSAPEQTGGVKSTRTVSRDMRRTEFKQMMAQEQKMYNVMERQAVALEKIADILANKFTE